MPFSMMCEGPTAACLYADMSLPQNLDDEEPIYQRTRTRMPLNHVSLDELDALLGKEDEGSLMRRENSTSSSCG